MDLFDLLYILGSGVVAGSFGFALGLGIRPGLKQRINDFAHGLIAEEINNFLKELHENPKFVSDLTDPLIDSVSKKFGVGESTGKARTVNIFGIKVPSEIVQFGLSRLMNNRQVKNVTPSLLDDLTQ